MILNINDSNVCGATSMEVTINDAKVSFVTIDTFGDGVYVDVAPEDVALLRDALTGWLERRTVVEPTR